MSDLHIHIPAPHGSGELHVHLHLPGSGAVLAAIQQLSEKVTMNDAQLKDAIDGVNTTLQATADQLAKATDEIVLAISNAGATSPATDAAVAKLRTLADALKTASQSLDDLNPDAP